MCVRARAVEDPHRDNKHEEGETPIVSMDYAYMEEEEGAKQGLPILVIKDHMSKYMTSTAVLNKGGGCSYAIKSAARDIHKLLGYKKIILRSDQEPAMIDFKNKLKKLLHHELQVMIEDTPVGDSKAAGNIENANKNMQAFVRTYKLAVEARVGGEIPVDHKIMPWIIKHASAMKNRLHVGKDGMTAVRRLKGRNFSKPICEIGECIWYCKSKTAGKNKARSRWESGIWLGIRDESGEVIVGTSSGVVKCRSVRRKPTHEERWNRVQLDEMLGTPWEPVPGFTSDEIPILSLIHI